MCSSASKAHRPAREKDKDNNYYFFVTFNGEAVQVSVTVMLAKFGCLEWRQRTAPGQREGSRDGLCLSQSRSGLADECALDMKQRREGSGLPGDLRSRSPAIGPTIKRSLVSERRNSTDDVPVQTTGFNLIVKKIKSRMHGKLWAEEAVRLVSVRNAKVHQVGCGYMLFWLD
jgi:hypothetical protein